MTRAQHIKYFMLHIFTASGAAWGFLALLAATQHDWRMMFVWLGVAQVVDAIDGPIARRVKIADKLPRWSGEILDLVIDYVTYVFVPAYAITVSGLLPHWAADLCGIAIVVTNALYFSDKTMKMEGNYFKGFPAIWNVAAFYLLLIAPPPAIATAMVIGFIVLSFVPIPFIHPLRVKHMRKFNLTLVAIWSVLAAISVANNMAAGPLVTGTLCVLGLYILGGGFLRKLPEGEQDAVSKPV